MLTVLALLIVAGDDEQARRPKASPPIVVIPIPTGDPVPYRYRLFTEWMTFTKGPRVWRTRRHLEKRGQWEEAVVGKPGARIRELVAETDNSQTFASTGSHPAGNGGVGEGFEWSVFVGDSWTAGIEMEFTTRGPRIVITATYYPYDGVMHRYGWSVLAAQFVHGIGWHFTEEDLQDLYGWPQLWAISQFAKFCRHYGLDP